MNRIVREHYPVSKLPEDLREGFGPDEKVRVTIDAPAVAEATHAEDSARPLSRFKHVRRANFASSDDVVAYVRRLRDE